MFISKTTEVEHLDLGSESVEAPRTIWILDCKREFATSSNRNLIGGKKKLNEICISNSGQRNCHEPIQENSNLKHNQTTELRVLNPNKVPTQLLMPEPEFNRLVGQTTISLFYLKYKESLCLRASYGILIILFAVLNSAVITVWPQYNVILNPQYWYEPLFPICLGYILIGSVGKNVQCYMVMKISKIKSLKSFVLIYIASVFGCIVTYVTIYILWVHYLRQCHPMPFIGHCCTLAMWICNNVALWLLLSIDTEAGNRLSQKRIWIYISLAPLILIIGIVYTQFSSFFSKIPTNYQWCLGILLPVMKKVSTIITTKVALKASQEESLSAKIAMITNVGSIHSFSVSLLMGSDISSTTAYVVMLLDSIPNILSFRKIVRLGRIGTNEQQMEEMKCLTLKEFMEISIPLVYCISFLIAYYGPNAEILGNVRNDYWQYQRINNVFEKLTNNAIFILVDAIRGTSFGLLLWRFCKLNMLKVYCDIISTYGILILVYVSGALAVVSGFYILNYKFK